MSSLYVLDHSAFNIVKVGNSTNPKKRLSSIKSKSQNRGLPHFITLREVYPGYGYLDHALWKTFHATPLSASHLALTLGLCGWQEWYLPEIIEMIPKAIQWADALKELDRLSR